MGMSQRLCGGRSRRGGGTRHLEVTEGRSEGGRAKARAGAVHSARRGAAGGSEQGSGAP